MQYLFEPNSRIELTKKGFCFYEKDVLNCKYAMSGNITVRMEVEYRNSGLGVVLGHYSGSSLNDSDQAYLFKLGTNSFSCHIRDHGNTFEAKRESNEIEPNIHIEPMVIEFEIIGSYVKAYKVYIDEFGDTIKNLVGSYNMQQKLGKYYLGIYSNEGNIIRNVSFVSKISDVWTVNSHNIRTGRVLFDKNSVLFEDCLHNAEIEQTNINLKKGKYYLTYDKDVVNGKFNIEAYIMKNTSFDKTREETYHNDFKNILQSDGSFYIDKDETIILRFIGTDGQISNISIGENANTPFVETKEDVVVSEGSEILIDMTHMSSVTWETTIKSVPNRDKTRNRNIEYSIIETLSEKYTLDNLHLVTNKKYKFVYQKYENKLIIYEGSTGHKLDELSAITGNHVKIMCNLNAIIYSLTAQRGREDTNLVKTKTIKHFVPSEIKSPIIVINSFTERPYDLSASYREVAAIQDKIYYVKSDRSIYVPEELPLNFNSMKVYGLPKTVHIDKTKNKIEEFASAYTLINEAYIKQTKYGVLIEPEIQAKYAFFAITYQSVQDFVYEFTNYEREVFNGEFMSLSLAKPMQTVNKDVIVYGVPHDAYISPKYLYRVPKGIKQSIDCYASKYQIIPEREYRVDFAANKIQFKDSIQGMYKEFVVDYLKKNSYSINLNRRMNQYEVDIATEETDCSVCYDAKDSGEITDYIKTDIDTQGKLYVVLKKEGE